MLILNKRIIDNFEVSSQDLEQIHLSLITGDADLFRQRIILPYREGLIQWVITEFPSLKEEASDIVEDVLLKFQKKLGKKKFTDFHLVVKDHLNVLTKAECLLALPTKENRQKNLGLSRTEFKSLKLRLQQGDEELIEKVYLHHFKRCVQYLIYRCGSHYDDAYNSTMEALLEIRSDLQKDRILYGNLDYYFTTRAKSKWYKLNTKKQEGPQSVDIDGMDFEEPEQIEADMVETELKDFIRQAFDKLCGDCKKIIRQYYYEDISLKDIADSLGKTHDSVRKQATRCRDKLRTHLGENFYDLFSSHLKE